MKRLVLPLLAFAAVSLRAESLRLDPAKDSRLFCDCSSSVHNFVAEVNSPVVTVETGEGVAGLKAARIEVAFSAVKTGDEDRDKDMLKRFGATANPKITYVVKSFSKDKSGAVVADGELTWNGVTKPLVVPVAITREGDALAVDAKFSLDHRDWGLKKIRSMLVLTVDPVLNFTVKLRGNLKPVAPESSAPVAAQ